MTAQLKFVNILLDDLDILSHLDHFFDGSSGLICKLNYLDVVSEWSDDECTEILNHLVIPSCFKVCDIQRFHLCARDRFCILPRMKKSMALLACYISKIFRSC